MSGCVREKEAGEVRQFKSKGKKGEKIILKKWFLQKQIQLVENRGIVLQKIQEP